MANFQPSGKILIGRVPFDNSYRHTLSFASREAQTTFFMGRMDSALEKDTYTYVRMNNSIRVMFNAERLYTYDYVMYQNSNYGDKWFYAFIDDVRYVNENCTELVLELDVMQTWYFDYTLVEGFVEREHVNDDVPGYHINPEPAMDLEYVYDMISNHTYETGSYFIVMLVTSEPHAMAAGGGSGNVVYTGADAVSGGLYQNLYSACKVHIYKGWEQTGLQQFQNDVKAYNESGAAESIVDVYCAPVSSIDANYLEATSWPESASASFTLRDGCPPGIDNYIVPKPESLNELDGYTPRNKKLFTFPYCYLELGDYTGRTEQLRWEFFPRLNPYAELRVSTCGVSDCQGYISPMSYNGINNGSDDHYKKTYKPFTFDFTNKISWVYSAYQNWIAQNSIVNQLAILGSTATMLAGAGAGLGAASEVLGAGLASAQNLGQLSGINSAAGQALLAKNSSQYAKAAADAYVNSVNTSMMAGGGAGIVGTAANIERMHRIPNTAKGNTSGNSKFQNGYCGWYYARVCIRNEFARIVDGFFDMYGYQVDSVKIPNRTGRPYWNYVKMQNSCHRGNVPSPDMSKINKIYDSGITFWHTADVGNYSLDNTIS